MGATSSTPQFFPRAEERGVLEFAAEEYPFPIALTYTWLQQAMDRQDPVAAAWQLRDAFECLIKFVASAAVADYLHAGLHPEKLGTVIGLLLKPGLSLGDWHALLCNALEPLERPSRKGTQAESGRTLPELFDRLFTIKGRRAPTQLNLDLKDIVTWRNRVFGHGVFRHDLEWYAGQTLGRLAVLHKCYEALRPALSTWSLVSVAPDGSEVTWCGAETVAPLLEKHRHIPKGRPTAMALRCQPTVRGTIGDEVVVPLGPFLSVQECAECQQPTPFFFDSLDRDRRHSYCLEYLGGHGSSVSDWDEVSRLLDRLPPRFHWERTSYDGREVDDTLALAFHAFEAEYLRPDALTDAFWATVNERPKGYVYLTGPEGTGKTYFVRGLEQEGVGQDTPVLAHYVLPGALTDYRTLLVEIGERARHTLRYRTQEIQGHVGSVEDLRSEFVRFFTELMQANLLETLVVAIDGLDELAEPSAGSMTITDLLPLPDQLPAGCYVLLTAREALHPRIRADLERLRIGPDSEQTVASSLFVHLEWSPELKENRELLRRYVRDRLPEFLRTPAQIDRVVERAGGVFLYVYHLCRALDLGVFQDVDSLPEGASFYSAYLDALRQRVGTALFDSAYFATLILLAAAQRPVTLRQLQRWGVPQERLQLALTDLRDFLHVRRDNLWHETLAGEDGERRYELAHDALRRFLQEDPELSARLREAHATIAQRVLDDHEPNWSRANPRDDADMYDLRFITEHLHAAGAVEKAHSMYEDAGYVSACVEFGDTALNAERGYLAEEFYARSLAYHEAWLRKFSEDQFHECGADDEAHHALIHVAMALDQLGAGFSSSGRHELALERYEQALDIWRFLEAECPHVDILMEKGRVAALLMNRGTALGRLNRGEDALVSSTLAEATYRGLINDELNEGSSHADSRDLAHSLASVILNKANALADLGRGNEAIETIDDAIGAFRRLAREGDPRADEDLATALSNKANFLVDFGRATEEGASSDEAIRLYRQLMGHGRQDLDRKLASTILNKINALEWLGRYDESLVWSDQAIASYRRMVEQGRFELLDDLAGTLYARGTVLSRTGRDTEALAAYEEAMAVSECPPKREGIVHSVNLARLLSNMGLTLDNLGRHEEALECFDRSSEILRSMPESDSLARAGIGDVLLKRGRSLANQERHAEALDSYRAAAEIYRALNAEDANRLDTSDSLATVLMNIGWELRAEGCLPEALSAFDESILARRAVQGQIDSAQFAEGFALALLNKGDALAETGQRSEAESCYSECIQILDRQVNAGARYLVPNLIAALATRFGLSRATGAWEEAAHDLVMALRIMDPSARGWRSALMRATELDEIRDALMLLSTVERAALLIALGDSAKDVEWWLERGHGA